MAAVGEAQELEIKWGKKRGIGGKKRDIQFYESFTYDGVEYRLYDTVFLYKENEPDPYIGKLIKIWEHSDKLPKGKILWFFRPSEISNYIGDKNPAGNELFLASGEGVGLANVVSLESVSGKCNVVCISKDNRNQQLSDEEVINADFIFYRMFDVGKLEISDKIDDKIAGVDVKFLLNRTDAPKSSSVQNLDLDDKEVIRNAVLTDDAKVLPNNTSRECKTMKMEEENAESRMDLDEQKPSFEEKPASSFAGKETAEAAKSECTRELGSSSNTSLKSKVVENADSRLSLVKQKSTLGVKPHDVPMHGGIAAQRNVGRGNISGENNILGPKVASLVNQKSCSHDRAPFRLGIQGHEVAEISGRQDIVSSDKTNLANKSAEDRVSEPPLVKQKSSVGEKSATNSDFEPTGRAKSNQPENLSNDKTMSGSKDGLVQVEEKLKAAMGSVNLDDGHSKKPMLDATVKVPDEKNKKNVQKLTHDSNSKDARFVARAPTAPDDKSKMKHSKDAHGRENGPPRKKKLDDKPARLANHKLPTPRQASNNHGENGNRILEVTRRPKEDKSKWFKQLPWEDRMKTAHERGTLVLLQNLDPSYTSAEVEDIVWHAFKETCEAKMIQRTAFSSPYYGQVLVILKTKEAAQMVIRRLDEGCLLLSNGRPLLASKAIPCFDKKPPRFCGHLILDKLRHQQMPREAKDAISTSHCSQLNTFEYDMAMEWCLLQEQMAAALKALHEKQGKEMEKLKAMMKSKQALDRDWSFNC